MMIRWGQAIPESRMDTENQTAPVGGEGKGPPWTYDAFTSYSTAADYRLAIHLEEFLEGFHEERGIRERGLRALKICTDGSDFSLGSRAKRSMNSDSDDLETIRSIIRPYLERSAALIILWPGNEFAGGFMDWELQEFLRQNVAHGWDRPIRIAVTRGEEPGSNPARFFADRQRSIGLQNEIFYDLRGRHPEALRWRKVRDFEREQLRLAVDLTGAVDSKGEPQSVDDFYPGWKRAKDLHAAKTQRRWIVAASFMAILALCAAMAATIARRKARIALSRQLTAQALGHLSTQPDLALLLNVRAHEVAPTIEARESLALVLSSQSKLVAHLHEFTNAVEKLRLTTDDRFLAASSPTERLTVWDFQKGKRLSQFHDAEGRGFVDIAFDAVGSSLAGGNGLGEIRVWKLTEPDAPPKILKRVSVSAIEFDASGRFLVTGGSGGELAVLEVQTGRVVWSSAAHSGAITAIARDPDGLHFFSCAMSSTNNVSRWRISDGMKVQSYAGHRMSVNALALNADGTRIATCGEEGSILIFDALTGATVQSFRTKDEVLVFGDRVPRTSGPFSVAFSRNERWLLSAGRQGRIAAWHIKDGKPAGDLHAHRDNAYGIAVASRSDCIVTGGADGKIRIWDLDQIHALGSMALPGVSSRLSTLSSNEHSMIVARDGTVSTWDLASKREIQRSVIANNSNMEIVALDGKWGLAALQHAAGGRPSGGVEIRYGNGFSDHRMLPDATASRGQCVYDPTGRFFASESTNSMMGLWEIASGRRALLKGLEGDSRLSAVCFSQDGSKLIAVDSQWAWIWSVLDGSLQARIHVAIGQRPPTCVTYMDTDQWLVCGYLGDGTIAVWKPTTKDSAALLGAFRSHSPATVRSVVPFQLDSKAYWLSLTGDGEAILWELPEIHPVLRVKGFGDGYVVAPPIGRMPPIAYGTGADGIYAYELSIDRWLAISRSIAGRALTDSEERFYMETPR